jgi:hypothetical protein
MTTPRQSAVTLEDTLRADGAAKDRRIAQLVRQRSADTTALAAILHLTYDEAMPDELADRIRSHIATRSRAYYESRRDGDTA